MTFRAKSRPSYYVPERGDIIHTDFAPSAGTEMALKHFALVLTPKAYNDRAGRAVVCPITSKIKNHPFNFKIPAIPPHLPEAGAVLTDQVRVVDFRVRGPLFSGHLEESTVREIIDMLFALLDGECD